MIAHCQKDSPNPCQPPALVWVYIYSTGLLVREWAVDCERGWGVLTSKSPSGVCEQKTGRLLGTFTIIKVRRKLFWKRSIIPSRTEQPFLFSPLHACWEDPPIFSLALLLYLVGFSCGSAGKEFTCNAGDLGSIPGLGRFPGVRKDYPLQYYGLENSIGLQRVRDDWATFTFTCIWFHSPSEPSLGRSFSIFKCPGVTCLSYLSFYILWETEWSDWLCSTGSSILVGCSDNWSSMHLCFVDLLSLHLRFFLSSGSDIHTSKVNFYWYKSLFQFCFCSLRHDTPSRFQLYTFFKEKYCRWHSKYIFPVYHLEPLVLAY